MKTIIYLPLFFLFLLFTGCEEEKIDIEKFGSLSGVVLDGEDYSPIEGALISTSPASSTTLTNAEGTFEFNKVKEGEVAITARKKDFLSGSVSVAVYENEATALTFFLLKDDKDVGWITIYDPVPGNGAVDQQTSFSFQWKTDQQNKSKELEYTVYYFESGSTVQKIAGENLTTKEVVVDGLDYSTTYYWYVVAKHEGDKVANSPTWSFKTRAENEE
ncbi:MAG: carboxypeptidase regulatory-like domain-containing protein [Tangfeifania sp.]